MGNALIDAAKSPVGVRLGPNVSRLRQDRGLTLRELSEVLSQVSERVAVAEQANASVAALPVVTGRPQAFVSAA